MKLTPRQREVLEVFADPVHRWLQVHEFEYAELEDLGLVSRHGLTAAGRAALASQEARDE